MMTRRILMMLVCLACVSALAFAGGDNEGNVEEQQLEVYVGPYTPNVPASVGPDLEVAQILADEYEEQHPGVTIEFFAAPADDWATALKTALAGGTAPDITTVQITQFWTDIARFAQPHRAARRARIYWRWMTSAEHSVGYM